MADKKKKKSINLLKFPKKPNLKNVKLDYLTPDQIKDSLWAHGWRNDTLSPVSTAPYWEITKDIIPEDAECISGFFATSYAGAFVHKMFTFICTTKYVYAIMEIAGVVTYKILKYEDFAEVNLYQDEYLSSQIYIDIYLTKFRFFRLEASDPTSIVSFKKTILERQLALHNHITLQSIASRSLAERAGISMWRFIWRKVRFILNIRTDAKVKRAIKKQRRLAKLKAKEDAKNGKKESITIDTHIESI